MAKMNSKIMMTPKDKKLLTGLLCFLIVVGFLQFLIIPDWNEKDKLKKEANNLQAEINTMQQTIDEMNNEAKSLNVLKKRFKELEGIFNLNGNVEDIDEQLTQLALTLGIDSQSINLTELRNPIKSHQSEKEEKLTTQNVLNYTIVHELNSLNYSTLILYLQEIEEIENIKLNQTTFTQVKDEDSISWKAQVVLTYYERQE